ncbi:RNA-binding motif, single-stranded-interacting protein 2 [Saguinus oedipus]|uniref:RNA-binding motif, single-stranded-interacting protein 2 n=1 Tax=Saguinus oedipus TaxID=9490 RepID=A0ABQ9UY06_SAGOE|nr:RNA-binding motif, single-stranded-interacting protein 2 [Saguinus oedipus]
MAPPSPSNSTPNSSSGSNGNDQLSKTNLYIRGLQPGTTDQDLVKLCQPELAVGMEESGTRQSNHVLRRLSAAGDIPCEWRPQISKEAYLARKFWKFHVTLLPKYNFQKVVKYNYMARLFPLRPYWTRPQTNAKVREQLSLVTESTSYGFVDFDSPSAAQKAVTALKASGVQAQMAKQQEQDPTNLYISNLPLSMDEQELEGMLKPFGQVISTRILRDTSGTSRGVGFARMESTEKCEAIITHFNGKYIKTPPGVPAPSDPLLCKFADGGPKKRQNQGKFVQNGRAWPRNGDMGSMALTYDPTTSLQNGFYPAPYNITPNRMLAQSALSPYLSSPISSYQGSVLTPGMDHPISLQPASMMGPLTQQLGHLSLSSTGTYMPTAAAMQAAYVSQYAPVPSSSVSVEESSSQQNQVAMDAPSEHGVYSFQFNK